MTSVGFAWLELLAVAVAAGDTTIIDKSTEAATIECFPMPDDFDDVEVGTAEPNAFVIFVIAYISALP